MKNAEVEVGDVVVTKAGPRHRVGVAAYVDRTPARLLVSGKMVLLRANPAAADPRFLARALSTPGPQAYLDARKTGMAESQMNFTNEDLLGLRIDIPNLSDQRRISDYLDTETCRIDQLITMQQRLLKLLEERDQALRDQLVNHLAEAFGEIPLRRFITRFEQGESPQCEAMPREAGSEWGVLKLSAVKRGHFNPTENKRVPEGTRVNREYEVQQGDLLISRANTPSLVGDAAVVDSTTTNLLLPDLLYRIALTSTMDAQYVAQVALSGRVRTLIESVARGSSQSMVKLRGEDIKNWPIPNASRVQQAEVLREIDRGTQATSRLRSAVTRQLRMLAERRRALITAAVTGQFDVSTASGRNVTDGV
ncbi:hypothetical protein [Streptomyces sp. EN27]|uniref:hypothetical protein n=1 Tax=Streptomyces sp. EN27 TaxID=211464 RepID=UPI00114D027E|nr:hypothetical protein [Streptomyces sp. EN27]